MMATERQTDGNPTFWDQAREVGKRASLTGQKAKMKADIVMLDQKIKTCKQNFGLELYEILEKSAEHDSMFMLESDALENIQGLFVTTYKDNKAFRQKQALANEKLEELAQERAKLNSRHGGRLSFEVPADTFGEKVLRAPANTRITGAETKIKASIAVMNRDMRANAQQFGIDCFDHLVKLETFNQWVPSDPNVQYLYNAARRDVAQLNLLKEERFEEIDFLDRES